MTLSTTLIPNYIPANAADPTIAIEGLVHATQRDRERKKALLGRSSGIGGVSSGTG
jgi:hypothetical protein